FNFLLPVFVFRARLGMVTCNDQAPSGTARDGYSRVRSFDALDPTQENERSIVGHSTFEMIDRKIDSVVDSAPRAARPRALLANIFAAPGEGQRTVSQRY